MAKVFGVFDGLFMAVCLCAVVCNVNAAPAAGRGYAANARSAAVNGANGRMPAMPTMPNMTVGNISGGGVTVPPADSQKPDVPDTPNQPDVPGQPSVPTECPDGGVQNSEYTVDKCMNDVLFCINTGGLANGLNDLFDENVRNSIVNGMGLCATQVEKCVTNVRRNCKNVYRSAADVWVDFNSRKIQPEYFNFVLRKTGLTPNQAENTCLMLDKNTYGSAFAAVSKDGTLTSEYNKTVGAYNGQQGNTLIKANPLGSVVNKSGIDAQRGHYARWDASTATCYVRVAAYNKDEHITNSWLFGAAGDDRPAEVWRATGESFACNKDLFGFSLMKDTSTVAVVGVAGGTVLGAGIGAAAGHGDRAFDCSHNSQLKELSKALRNGGKIGILNQFLSVSDAISTSDGDVKESQCRAILDLYNLHNAYVAQINQCSGADLEAEDTFEAVLSCQGSLALEECFKTVAVQEPVFNNCVGKNLTSAQACVNHLKSLWASGVIDVDVEVAGECTFKPINLARAEGRGVECFSHEGGCLTLSQIKREIEPLTSIFSGLDILKGEQSNMGKSVGIGAAAGAGAGGLATAITAFVERGNINCRVGDGLVQVGLGKSHVIDTLKDFYVKWNLNLPETAAPTAMVDDCESWNNTCAMYSDLNQCTDAQFNYKPVGAPTVTLVRSACAVSGSICVTNYPVAVSHGACE